MQYIVIDLEWNQSLDGKPGKTGLTFEIIEIGALKLNERWEVTGEFQEVVQPQLYPRMNEIIGGMVPISQEELDGARTFPEVMGDFLEWCGSEPVFCTWGSMDLWELQKNMDYYGVKNPFPRPLYYYDIQKLYSLCFDDGKSRISLETAVERLSLKKKEAFHRAKQDCAYTAQVLSKLDWQRMRRMISVDYYRLPRNREEEIWLVFPGYAKYVSREFDSKEEAMKDKRVTAAVCCRCRRTLRKKIQWFSPGGKIYYCLAECPEHGYVQGKIRIKKSEEDKTFAVKTLKLVPEETAERIRLRKEEIKEKKRQKSLERKQKQNHEA